MKGSPDIDTDKPVSRQHEMQYLTYYRYPFYWAGEGLFAQGGYPGSTLVGLSSRGSDAGYREAQGQVDRAMAQAECREDGDPSPGYDPAVPLSRDYEVNLYKHYGRTGYWADEVKAENSKSRATATSSRGAAQVQVQVQVQHEAARPRT